MNSVIFLCHCEAGILLDGKHDKQSETLHKTSVAYLRIWFHVLSPLPIHQKPVEVVNLVLGQKIALFRQFIGTF
jgi:hypothetical protein